jgi:hypothetical protein
LGLFFWLSSAAILPPECDYSIFATGFLVNRAVARDIPEKVLSQN